VAECKYLPNCSFFTGRLASYAPGIVESMRREYCLNDGRNCARRAVRARLGSEGVPVDLAPADQAGAAAILHSLEPAAKSGI